MNSKVCKVTFSLASIQRPGHWAHNRKMTHWGLLSLPSTTGMGQVKDSRMILHSVGLSCSTFTFCVWIPCLQILSGMAFLNVSPCRRTLEGQFADRHFFGVSLVFQTSWNWTQDETSDKGTTFPLFALCHYCFKGVPTRWFRILAVRPLYLGTKWSKMERCKQCTIKTC